MKKICVGILLFAIVMTAMITQQELPKEKTDSLVLNFLSSGIEPTPSPTPDIEKEIEELKKENQKIRSVVNRGRERKPSVILDYNQLSAPKYLVELVERMCKSHGFDSIREIYSIIWYESRFDPTCHATVGEDSRGLLQVNVADPHHKARHPRADKLYDAAYNLEYQLDELKIYYDKGRAQGLNGVDLAIYISKYGQRPNWPKAGAYIVQTIKKYDKEYLSAVIAQ